MRGGAASAAELGGGHEGAAQSPRRASRLRRRTPPIGPHRVRGFRAVLWWSLPGLARIALHGRFHLLWWILTRAKMCAVRPPRRLGPREFADLDVAQHRLGPRYQRRYGRGLAIYVAGPRTP